MHIKIVGFKCHIDTHYDFNSGEMILLKGRSGVGKSTILQAIYWALYGSMRGVYNNTGKIKSCSVTLQINDLIIYRQKNPELLRVTIKGVDYEDIIGQQIIDQAFGSKDLWKSCAYIEQKGRCALLSGSAAERLTLLNQLSFNVDNPKDYISKIDSKLKEINKEFIETQASFNAELSIFTKQMSERSVAVVLSQSDLDSLNNDINNMETTMTELYQKVLDHERYSGSYTTISNQLNGYRSQLNSLVVPELITEDEYSNQVNQLNSKLNEFQSLLNNYNINMKKIDSKDKLVTQLADINQRLDKIIIDDNMDVTSEMVWSVKQTETLRQQNIAKCDQLGISYNQSVINSQIAELNNLLEKQRYLQNYVGLYNQLKLLMSQLSSLNVTPDTDILQQMETNLNNKNIEISELRKGLELLQCPSCSAPLRYDKNRLIHGDRSPVSQSQIDIVQREIRQLNNDITKLRSALNLSSQISQIESQLSDIDTNELETFDPSLTNTYNNRLNMLLGIRYIDESQYSSAYLSQVLEKNNLTQQKIHIESQISLISIDDMSIDPVSINTEIGRINRKINEYHDLYRKNMQYNTHKNNLVNNITQLESQLVNIQKYLNHNAKSEYDQTKTKLTDVKRKYDDAMYGNKMLETQKELEIKRENVISLNSDLANLGQLKQIAIETECAQLQETVDSINHSIDEILPLFFDDPISLELQLFKTLKTKKDIKPGLSVVIKYKGVEYDNINQLSGGEGDRISLALILALNQVGSSPILLLDECISSLDGSLKETCITAMKSLKSKTIICVDHEGVDGFYDKVISVH